MVWNDKMKIMFVGKEEVVIMKFLYICNFEFVYFLVIRDKYLCCLVEWSLLFLDRILNICRVRRNWCYVDE